LHGVKHGLIVLLSLVFGLWSLVFGLCFPAQMAKLVDALVSGTSVSNDVQVRVLFWALKKIKDKRNKNQERILLHGFSLVLGLVSLILDL
jgi:hypothetical protein